MHSRFVSAVIDSAQIALLVRILRVLCSKLKLEGDFDFLTLAKATPGYVGADLASLTSTAGIIAVKRIFQELSQTSVESSQPNFDADTSMAVDAPSDQTSTRPAGPPNSSTEQTDSSIIHFLQAYPNPLIPEQLEPLCVTFDDFTLALKQVQPSAKREGFATVPDVTWADIGALHTTREELHMAIVQPIRRPELFTSVGITAACGVLLWGPPGCGKTLLAKAVANESRANFISVKGPELLNKASALFSITFAKLMSTFFSMSERVKELSGKSSLVPEHRPLVSSSSTSSML